MKIKLVHCAIAFTLLASCSTSVNTDSPMPAMFMKDAAHTGFYPSPPLIHQPSVAWKFKTGNKVISSPVISKNLIYIGSSDGYVYALADIHDEG